MNTEMRVLLTQVMGLAVLLLGNLGIELSAEDKLTVVNGLTALGLMLSSLVAYWPRLREWIKNRPSSDGQDSGV